MSIFPGRRQPLSGFRHPIICGEERYFVADVGKGVLAVLCSRLNVLLPFGNTGSIVIVMAKPADSTDMPVDQLFGTHS